MSQNEQADFSFLKPIKDNWVILAFLVSLVIGWTTMNTRLANAEAKIDQLSQVVTQINAISLNVAVIQTDVNYIQKDVEYIKKKVQ